MADTDSPATSDLERRLATILSADVAGYSRLMAEDEEQTLRIFRGHSEVFNKLVALHRGRVFNTAGDAILAEFGSAVEAVRCATEIQAALRTRNDQLPDDRQVKFRIGVNLGDVMVQGEDLLGDGVNVAARLQTAAEPGGICLSGGVYDQIRNKLSLSFKLARRAELQEYSPGGPNFCNRRSRRSRRATVSREPKTQTQTRFSDMGRVGRCVAADRRRRFLGLFRPSAYHRRNRPAGAIGDREARGGASPPAGGGRASGNRTDATKG